MVMNPNDPGSPWQATMQLAARGCLGGFQTEAELGSGGSRSIEGLLCRWMGVVRGTVGRLQERPREGHLIKSSSCSETIVTPERCVMSLYRLQGGGALPGTMAHVAARPLGAPASVKFVANCIH